LLAKHILGDLSPSQNENEAILSLTLESLVRACLIILDGYGKASIWRCYRSYINPIASKEQPTIEETSTKSTGKRSRDTFKQPESVIMWKRTRRGRRGGAHFLQGKKPRDEYSTKRIVQTHESAPHSSQTMSVGERLFSHTLRNGLFDKTICSDGYESQDEKLLDTSFENEPDYPSLPTSSSKKRKRKQHIQHATNLGKDSHSSSSPSLIHDPFHLNEANPGLICHLEMRKMQTEVLDDSFFFCFIF
jgi:hypothetical protein